MVVSAISDKKITFNVFKTNYFSGHLNLFDYSLCDIKVFTTKCTIFVESTQFSQIITIPHPLKHAHCTSIQ